MKICYISYIYVHRYVGNKYKEENIQWEKQREKGKRNDEWNSIIIFRWDSIYFSTIYHNNIIPSDFFSFFCIYIKVCRRMERNWDFTVITTNIHSHSMTFNSFFIFLGWLLKEGLDFLWLWLNLWNVYSRCLFEQGLRFLNNFSA